MRAAFKAVAAFFGLIPGWIWALVLAGASVYGVWAAREWDSAQRALLKLEATTASQEAARAKVAATANSNFRKFEHQQAAMAAEIEDEAQTLHANARAADERNRTLVGGLQRTIDELDARARSRAMSGAPACAGESEASRREAEIARGLLGACAAEYRDLGGEAERNAIDLGTALKYVDLVQTPAPDLAKGAAASE